MVYWLIPIACGASDGAVAISYSYSGSRGVHWKLGYTLEVVVITRNIRGYGFKYPLPQREG